MLNTFKYTALALLRDRSVIIWVILFPLVLATLFNAMFAGIDETAYELDPVPVSVVGDTNGQAGEAFEAMMDALSDDEDGSALVDPVYVNAGEALDLLRSGDTVGTITLDDEGWPSLQVSPDVGDVGVSMGKVERTILADIVNNYCRSRTALEDIAAVNPMALADRAVVESMTAAEDHLVEISITHSKTKESVRYFYALLGFAAFMTAVLGVHAVGTALPNVSPLGARRTMGGTSRARTLAGAITASWVLAFASLLVTFAYIRWALGIDFGDRDGLCILGLAIAALMTTSFGAVLGAFPAIPLQAKSGVLTGVTCFLSLFAGLYGTPAVRLADQVARDMPWAAAINPVKQVTDLFYSLYVYNDLSPFFQTMGVLVVMAAVFALVAALLMRRQSYARL